MADDPWTESWFTVFFLSVDHTRIQSNPKMVDEDYPQILSIDFIKFFSILKTQSAQWRQPTTAKNVPNNKNKHRGKKGLGLKLNIKIRILLLLPAGINQPLLFSWWAECQRSVDTDYPRILTAKMPADVDHLRIQSLWIRIIRRSKFSRSSHLWSRYMAKNFGWWVYIGWCQQKDGRGSYTGFWYSGISLSS